MERKPILILAAMLMVCMSAAWLRGQSLVTPTGTGGSAYLASPFLKRKQLISEADTEDYSYDKNNSESTILWPGILNIANSRKTQVYVSVSEHVSSDDNMENTTGGPTYNASGVVGYPRGAMGSCSYPMCDLNYGRNPIQFLTGAPKDACTSVAQCVTLITKTRYRLHLVANLIRSCHAFYPGTKVIVTDDFSTNYTTQAPKEWLDLYDEGRSVLVTYVQVEEGISNGRNIALQLAATKYVVLADDDHVFNKHTDLMVLLKVLENTDASIAGGQFTDKRYDSLLRVFFTKLGRVHLVWYPFLFYESLYPFADCYVTDRVQNFFLAKRHAIMDTGGWERRRKTHEHVDFFLNLRRKSIKVVYCPEVLITHNRTDHALHEGRMEFAEVYDTLMKRKWHYEMTYTCHPDSYRLHYPCRYVMTPIWKIPCPEIAAKWGETITKGMYKHSVCGYPLRTSK